MEIVQLNDELAKRGLAPPPLEILTPDEQVYTAALFQPDGNICTSDGAVRLADPADGERFEKFIEFACERTVHLAACPEYAMPRKILLAQLSAGIQPQKGALWAFGCDSLPVNELPQFIADLEAHCTVVVEESRNFDQERFLNPVVLLFHANSLTGDSETLVALLQFKTHPGADEKNFEATSMEKGKLIYMFGSGDELRFVTFLCADAFKLDEPTVGRIHEETLMLHLQFNTGFRNADYKRYRDHLSSTTSDRHELICLNWTDPVQIDGTEFGPLGGSAWYLPSGKFAKSDKAINDNHARGMYYARQNNPHAHAFYLNHAPGIYAIKATKVFNRNSNPQFRATGPTAKEFFSWDSEQRAWSAGSTNSGFDKAARDLGDAQAELLALASDDPLAVERIVNLSLATSPREDWFELEILPTCIVKHDEFIHRVTFCQDPEAEAVERRSRSFVRVGELRSIVSDPTLLPQAMKDLADSGQPDWTRASPHQNFDAIGGRATAINLGDDASPTRISAVKGRTLEHLRRSIADPIKRRSARQRFAIFFKKGTEILHSHQPELEHIDDPGELSHVDLAKEQ